MYMTTEDIRELANEARVMRKELSPGYFWWKHRIMLSHYLKLVSKQCKQRLTLAANRFPRKACYPYGEQAMGEPKATGQDVWKHISKRG